MKVTRRTRAAIAIAVLSVLGAACGGESGGAGGEGVSSDTPYSSAAKSAAVILKDACEGATVDGVEMLDQGHVFETYVPDDADDDTSDIVKITWSGVESDAIPVSQVCDRIDDVVMASAEKLATVRPPG